MQEDSDLSNFQPDTTSNDEVSNSIIGGGDTDGDSIESSYSDSLESENTPNSLSDESSIENLPINGHYATNNVADNDAPNVEECFSLESNAEQSQNDIPQDETHSENPPDLESETSSGCIDENAAPQGNVSFKGRFDSDAYNALLEQKNKAHFDMTHSSNYAEFDDAWHRRQEADKAMGEMIAESDSYKELTSRIDRQLEEYQGLLGKL